MLLVAVTCGLWHLCSVHTYRPVYLLY